MDAIALNTLVQTAKQRIHIVTSSAAYAISTLEKDLEPTFQLGTVLRMGLSDDEVKNPAILAQMRWEYKVWALGHALADISEYLATLLNELTYHVGAELGCSQAFRKFERLGLDKKFEALTELDLEHEYQTIVESVVRSRNCLVHRHGIVGDKDCNEINELSLTWIGIKVYKLQQGNLLEFDPSHRGPAVLSGETVQAVVAHIERRFRLGERMDLDPFDLCTFSSCIQGMVDAIYKAVAAKLMIEV